MHTHQDAPHSSEIPNLILLIDLENCPNHLSELMSALERYSLVVICYAQSEARIPIDWLEPLSSAVMQQRLKIQKMPSNGKNAADFGITFWAGVLMQQYPANCDFTIASEDTDLDHVIRLLKQQGRHARRFNPKIQSSPVTAGNESVSSVPVKEYCEHLLRHSKNRPVKRSTLLNHINSKYRDNLASPEKLIEALISNGAIAISNDKITYNETKISHLSKNHVACP